MFLENEEYKQMNTMNAENMNKLKEEYKSLEQKNKDLMKNADVKNDDLDSVSYHHRVSKTKCINRRSKQTNQSIK